MNTCNVSDHQLNSETEIVPGQRLWLEVKLCEIFSWRRVPLLLPLRRL